MVPASGGSSISIIWNSAGTKTVTLQVTVGPCVSSVTTQTVTVKPRPSAAFNPASPAVCAESSLQFTYAGAPAEVVNYFWNFGTGIASPSVNAQNPSTIWNAGATVPVPVTFFTLGTNGCYSDTITQNIVVNPKPVAAIFSPDSVCQNANLTLNSNLPQPAGSVFAWNFAGATVVSGNPATAGPFVLTWPNAGDQNVILTITSPQGCVSEDSIKVIEVNPIPSSQFSISMPSVCIGVNSSLSQIGVTGTAPSFLWTSVTGSVFSASTASSTLVNFSAAGTAPVNLRVIAEGCTSAVTTQNIDILPTPSATFTASASVCQGEPAQVDYTGSGSNNALFNWSYSGGTPSTGTPGLAPFNVTWNSAGTKTITLTVTEFGCSSLPFDQDVLVNAIPTAILSSNSPSCAGLNDTITYGGNASAAANYSWVFTGATVSTATGQGPHYVSWANPGAYSVSLVVSENGCTSNPNQIPVQVNPIPVADFSVVSPVCKFMESQIIYTGTTGNSVEYTWDFNNGSVLPGTGMGPHVSSWNSAGTKTLSLFVVSLGCVSPVFTQTVEVLELPLADAGLNQWSCSGGTVDLGTPAVVGNTYQWSPSNGLSNPFDAQTQASAVNPTNGPVEFTYILRVSDGQCINRDTVVYEVIQPVNVSFVPPAGQCFFQNSFDFEAIGNFSPAAVYSWNFGPNASVATSNNPNPSGISYSTTGLQTVSLQAEENGCFSNTFTSAVYVYEEPNVDFSISSPEGCAPHKVFFSNLSNNTMNVAYEWYYGNGEEAIGFSPSHVYDEAGDFSVTLYVRAENGCDTGLTLYNQVHIYPLPNPLFYLNRNDLIMASDTASEVLRVWEAFGGFDSTHFVFSPSYADPEKDTLLSGPEHEVAYSQPGVYSISHYVESEWGCIDSMQLNVIVRNEIVLYIPSSFTPDGDGINDVFMVFGQDIKQFEMQVYNRWGEKIFHTYDAESGWDGRSNSSKEELDYGTYYYVVRVLDSKSNWHKIDGYINIIR
jgi:gliding motility-associated-like protein